VVVERRSGVVTFTGALFLVLAFFNAVDGIVAFADPGHFYVSADGLLVVDDYDAYGFVLLVIAGIELAIGAGILLRMQAARWFGLLVALISLLIHFMYFKHYPAWSVVALALDAIVIYALTVHGDEFVPTDG
jgi:hypothetical protein